jgi:aspartate-semialdehyde dehydrogenase
VEAPIRLGVAGATGAVGLEMLRVLEERALPLDLLRPMASDRGRSRSVRFGGRDLEVEELSDENLQGLDVVLFATGPPVSRRYAPAAAAAGAVAIDNSRAFRMDPGVPLVVPEVNPRSALDHGGIIANPNCSTIQMVLVLKPIHDAAVIERVIVSTYQSVSGTGLAAIDELTRQSRAVLDDLPTTAEVYPLQIAFNCIPHIDEFDDEGTSREETKMILETRKIMGLPDLRVAATCVRVPVIRSHAMAIAIETERELTPREARSLLAAFPGVRVLDDPGAGAYPTSLDATGNDDVWVGRVRRDPSVAHGLWVWAVTDNLRKGAATNAVQIAELLIGGADG